MLCCILCCLPAPQADLTRFQRVIVLGVSTAKRKTRLHTDFRSARRSKRINPLKITLPTQFLRRIEEEMSKLHVSSLATQFRPQRLRYDTFFFSRFLCSQLQKQARTWICDTRAVRTVRWLTIIILARPGVVSNDLSTRKPKCSPGTPVLYLSNQTHQEAHCFHRPIKIKSSLVYKILKSG